MSNRQRQKQTQNSIEIEQRRLKVAGGILQGLTYREIAIQLNVSPATIAGDRKAIIREWRKNYTDKTDEWIEIQMRRLDTMINSIWARATGKAAGQNGEVSLPHLDRLDRLMTHQERLLGIGLSGITQSPTTNVSINVSIDDFTQDIQQAKNYEREQYGLAHIPTEPSPN